MRVIKGGITDGMGVPCWLCLAAVICLAIAAWLVGNAITKVEVRRGSPSVPRRLWVATFPGDKENYQAFVETACAMIPFEALLRWLLTSVEGRVINDDAPPFVMAEIQRLEILGGSIGKTEGEVHFEPKTGIVARITQDDTSSRTKLFYPVKAGFDEPDTDALPLPFRLYGYWPEAVPTDRLTVDFDGRESDMANEFAAMFCDQRYRQCASIPQAIDDRSFRAIAIWRFLEGGGDKGPDFWDIPGFFRTDDHDGFVANDRVFFKTRGAGSMPCTGSKHH